VESAQAASQPGGSENKIAIVAAISLNEGGHPIHARNTTLKGFSSDVISNWTKRYLAPGSDVLFNALACFHTMNTHKFHPKVVLTDSKHPKDMPQVRRVTPS
jgi:hypothetical protein